MPRPKTRPDIEVLAVAHRLLHEHGPEALTFAALAGACGLSASTLVQRFRSKPQLVRSTLAFAWDRLDEKTARLAAEQPRTPAGAVALLKGLSGDYGGIEAYADGLLILREDLRDPVLRARGTVWKELLCRALDACFADVPQGPPKIGLLLASQWQGALLWWSFDPRGDVAEAVEASLLRFLVALDLQPLARRTRSAAQAAP